MRTIINISFINSTVIPFLIYLLMYFCFVLFVGKCTYLRVSKVVLISIVDEKCWVSLSKQLLPYCVYSFLILAAKNSY